MALVKNCYTGDMAKPVDGGAQFFESSPTNKNGANYCYNSYVLMNPQASDGLLHLQVLRDSKDGQIYEYDYTIAPEELKKSKRDTPLLSLKGLKGECFSANGNTEACAGGILKTIGLQDTNIPMIIAVGKASSGRYTVSHLVYDEKEWSGTKLKELEPLNTKDTTKLTNKMLQEVRRKLVTSATTKMASLRNPAMTARKLAESSEQFRYCTLALESFLKERNLPDPMSSDEKMVMAKLSSIMNGDPTPVASQTRLPASAARQRAKHN